MAAVRMPTGSAWREQGAGDEVRAHDEHGAEQAGGQQRRAGSRR